MLDFRVRKVFNVLMDTLQTSKKPAAKDWNKAHIKAAVEIAGYTLRGLSRKHGMSPAYFREALHRPIPRAQAILAELLGLDPRKIWPSRYERDGSPKSGLYDKSHANGRDYQSRIVRNACRNCKANPTELQEIRS